jgi:hydroxyacylglutathione hydrolase
MIIIKNFVFNELAVNSFVLYDETRECIVVDPGCNSDKQRGELLAFITGYKLKPVYIVNTHGHFDHIFGNSWSQSVFACPLLIHKEDLPLIEHADKFAGIFGFAVEKPPMPDRYLKDGEFLHFGESSLKILHVPGHSPGSICLYDESDSLLICGDVLFNGSIGRTDLLGGDYSLLIRGIQEKLMTLPGDTVVWPGHGPKTTIRHEYDTNPFLK